MVTIDKMVDRWSGSIEAGNILASATSGRFKAWWEERGVTFMVDNNAVIEASDVVFVAVKPHLYSGMFDKYVSMSTVVKKCYNLKYQIE